MLLERRCRDGLDSQYAEKRHLKDAREDLWMCEGGHQTAEESKIESDVLQRPLWGDS